MEVSREARRIVDSAKTENSDSSPCVKQKPALFKTPPKRGSKFSRKHRTASKKTLFEEHISEEEATDGIKNGKFFKGILRVNAKSHIQGFVPLAQFSNDVFIDGYQNRNRAFHGDEVVVQLFPKETWTRRGKSASNEIEKENEGTKPSEHSSNEERKKEIDDVMLKMKSVQLSQEENAETPLVSDDCNLQPRGKIVHILKRSRTLFVGYLSPLKTWHSPKTREILAQFVPQDDRFQKMQVIHTTTPEQYEEIMKDDGTTFFSEIYIVKMERWNTKSTFPVGQIVSSLGRSGDVEAETRALIERFQLHAEEFSEEVQSALPPLPWSIAQEELDRRLDLRNELIFTIDPATAKDLDDAVSYSEEVKDGDHYVIVGVHIADVSHFIPPLSALDTEAELRSTSVYFVDRVIPMLPRMLCEQLCSLNPDVDRLAFSCFFIYKNGNFVRERFEKTVIRSAAKLAYSDAQAVLDGCLDETTSPLLMSLDAARRKAIQSSILKLADYARNLRTKRFEQGALQLNEVKLSFQLDEVSQPLACGPYQLAEANWLIEELMLQANPAAATTLLRVFPNASLLRRHNPPVNKQLSDALDLLKELGYPFGGFTAASLHNGLEALRRDRESDALKVQAIEHLITAPMKRAEYVDTSTCTAEELYHYGLAKPFYTHFTSPIRRYPDLIVHRLLFAATELEKWLQTNQQTVDEAKATDPELFDRHLPQLVKPLATVCSEANERKENAKDAGDASIRMYFAVFIRDAPVTDRAIVVSMADASFSVLTQHYGLLFPFAEITLRAQGLATMLHDRATHTLTLLWGTPTPDGDHTKDGDGVPYVTYDIKERTKISLLQEMSLTIASRVCPPPITLLPTCHFEKEPVDFRWNVEYPEKVQWNSATTSSTPQKKKGQSHAKGRGGAKSALQTSPHDECKDDETALHFAARNGHLDIATLLLDRGVDVETKNKRGQTPLLVAVQKGHLPVAELLLDRGANIEAKQKDGDTALHNAARKGHMDLARLLLDRGADVEAKDEVGNTPLHIAAAEGCLPVAQMLLDRGADIYARDKNGQTPLDHAKKSRQDEMMELLGRLQVKCT